CSTCGAVDSHPTTRCPTVIKCRNCGKLGHLQNVRRKCNSTNHNADACPLIWRVYIPVDKPPRDFKLPIFCYNCASSTHYGDNCPFPSRHRRDGVSAFNLANAPISREEESRLEKADRIAVAKRRESRRGEEQDDWFSRRERDKKRGLWDRVPKERPPVPRESPREGLFGGFRRGRNSSRDERPGSSRFRASGHNR
ncbi:Protein air1, partial [Neolecta irregularis DAH-3]